ncbi:metal-sulfur cluster assembly factor [Pararcticibacter amylolyticus]|nr:metal-sulfur cluster assembly factor [Pararcticibacter amylolyticus]
MNSFNITDSSTFTRMNVMETLRTIPDPELNVNIIDLGLVYNVEVKEPEKEIIITMTLSSKHCPMGEAILQSVKNGVKHNFEDFSVEVNLTWEPQWGYDNITEEGLKQLRGQ